MGNCLVVHEENKDSTDQVIKIMKLDGKVLEYQSPMKVEQVLSQFPAGHSITDALPAARHLDPLADMRGGGHLYYLLRPKKALQVIKKLPAEAAAVRVSLVISKQELKEILEREGLTLDDMMSQVQKKKITGNCTDQLDSRSCMGSWKPDLESIPEGNIDH